MKVTVEDSAEKEVGYKQVIQQLRNRKNRYF